MSAVDMTVDVGVSFYFEVKGKEKDLQSKLLKNQIFQKTNGEKEEKTGRICRRRR